MRAETPRTENEVSDEIWILGINMTKFGKHPDLDTVDLGAQAIMAALVDAGFRIDHSEAGLYLWATRGEPCWETVSWCADRGVVVTPGDFYGTAGAHHVRIAFTATDAAVKAFAEQALALVGLQERLDHFPAQLSGGEQQRVAIARAIVKRPQVLLCDEPTGALDYATGKQVLEVIETINRELGTTTVVITHNAAIAGMADRVIHLAGGRIAREERPAHKLRPSELSW